VSSACARPSSNWWLSSQSPPPPPCPRAATTTTDHRERPPLLEHCRSSSILPTSCSGEPPPLPPCQACPPSCSICRPAVPRRLRHHGRANAMRADWMVWPFNWAGSSRPWAKVGPILLMSFSFSEIDYTIKIPEIHLYFQNA
jgi:hypothetical protein